MINYLIIRTLFCRRYIDNNYPWWLQTGMRMMSSLVCLKIKLMKIFSKVYHWNFILLFNNDFIVVELERLERRLRVERMVRTQLRQSKWELWGRRLTPAITWLYRASVLLTLLLLLEQQEGKKVSRLSSAHGEYKLMAYDFRCTLAHIHWLRMYNDNTINTATLRLWQCN